MSGKSSLLLTLILLFCSIAGEGQDYLSDLNTFTQKDGLSSRFTQWVYEDSRGFVWIPTDNGLNRFDGHDFKVFNTENSNLFSDRSVMVYEDVNGNIWVGYQTTGSSDVLGWRSIITPDFEIFDLDDFFKNELPFPAKEIHQIQEAPQKGLIITTDTGVIYKYDGSFKKLVEDKRLKNFNFVHLDQAGQVYFLSLDFLLIAKTGQETQTIKRPTKYHLPVMKDSNIFWYVHQDLNNNPSKAKMYSSKDTFDLIPHDYFKKDENISFQSLIPYTSFITFFFKYEDLLKKYHPETGEVAIVSKKLSEEYPTIEVQSGRFTRNNKYWFSSLGGINLLTYKPNPFKNYLKGMSQSCRAISKIDKDRFLVAPRIIDFNPKTKAIQNVSKNKFPPSRSFVKLGDDKILMGDYGTKLYVYDLIKETIEAFPLTRKDHADFSGRGFLVPFMDKVGNIWMGTDNGLVEFNPKIDSLEVFKKYNEFGELAKEKTNWFKEYDDGIWGACSKGLFVLKPEEGIVAWHQPLPDLRVEHFLREGDVFWIATYGEGLIKWNAKTGETKKYGLENGLLDEHLMAVYPDKKQNLWITTNWGMARFNKAKEKFNVFLKSDGINYNEFNISSHFQDENGELYFGGLDGITAFDPNNFSELKKDSFAKLVLTGYEEIDTKYNIVTDKTANFLKEKSIDVASDVKTFIINFALLNYENTEYTTYAHKIEGLDKDWIYEKENHLKLSRLPFGEYTLRLKAIDYHGNEYNEIAVPLSINAPFYASKTCIVICFLLFGGLVYFFIKRRESYLLIRQEKLEQIVNERTAELRSLNETKDRLFAILAHDLRNPVIAFEELSETINYLMQKNEPERISKLGNQIELEAKQLHHLLDNLLNWALTQREEVLVDFSTFNLKGFLIEIADTFMPLATRAKIDLSIDCDPNIQITTDKRLIEIVARNVLTNAFKYTKSEGRIELNGKVERGNIFLQIKDNGVGMTNEELENLFDVKRKFRGEATTSTVSLGMHLCKELMDLIEGDISAETKIGKWTLVTMKMPIRTLYD